MFFEITIAGTSWRGSRSERFVEHELGSFEGAGLERSVGGGSLSRAGVRSAA